MGFYCPDKIAFDWTNCLISNKNNTKQVYIEKKTSLYLLCDDYVLSITDGTSVSTFLCTRKLGPEEVSVSLIAV